MKQGKIIKTPHGANRMLASEFGVHETTVSWALNGRSKSFVALEIRKRARQIIAEFEKEF